jgi:hypothetical protein
LAAPVSSTLCFLCSRASDCCLQRSRGDRKFFFLCSGGTACRVP